jgi:hypothetical protein
MIHALAPQQFTPTKSDKNHIIKGLSDFINPNVVDATLG